MKKIACLAVFFGLCVLVVSVGAAEMRTWTAGGGKFTTEAELVEVSKDGLFVTLRKKVDGKEIQVAMDRLSEEDREYIANPKKPSPPLPVNPVEQQPVDDSAFKVTEENFVRYEDDGTVVIKSKSGEEQKKHIRELTQDDMNCIIRQELKKPVDPQLFQPDVIRKQIDAYCEANPLPSVEEKRAVPDETEAQRLVKIEESKRRVEVLKKQREQLDKQSFDIASSAVAASIASFDKKAKRLDDKQRECMDALSKLQQEERNLRDLESYSQGFTSNPLKTKTITEVIDWNLTSDEKNCLTLLLVKYQEHLGKKMSQSDFVMVMEKVYSKRDGNRSSRELELKQMEVYRKIPGSMSLTSVRFDAMDFRYPIREPYHQKLYSYLTSYGRSTESINAELKWFEWYNKPPILQGSEPPGRPSFSASSSNSGDDPQKKHFDEILAWIDTEFKDCCNHFAAHKYDDEIQGKKAKALEEERIKREDKERSEKGKKTLDNLFQ